MSEKFYYIPQADLVHSQPDRWEQFAVEAANKAQQITEQATEFIELVGTRQGSAVLLPYLKMLDSVDQLQRMFDHAEDARATKA